MKRTLPIFCATCATVVMVPCSVFTLDTLGETERMWIADILLEVHQSIKHRKMHREAAHSKEQR